MAPNDRTSGTDVPPPRMRRREFLAASAVGALGLTIAAGCGGSSSTSSASTSTSTRGQTIEFLNYLNWIGKGEYAEFKTRSGITVHEVVAPPSVSRDVKVIESPGLYDMALFDLQEGGRVNAAGDLAKIDLSKVPNYKYVADAFKQSLCSPEQALISPTDYGRIGILYRTDMVSEDITTWKDVWDLAPKYSGKITFFDFEPACLSISLISLGYDANSKNTDEITKAADHLIDIKPHLLALLESNEANDVVSGSAAIGMVEDFAGSAAMATHASPNLKWVEPQDGTSGYLEGWSLLKSSSKADAVQQFMNFHLEPKVTANFVNTQKIASIEPAASKYVLPSIKNNPIGYPPPGAYDLVHFQQFLGPAQAVWDDQWARFKSA